MPQTTRLLRFQLCPDLAYLTLYWQYSLCKFFTLFSAHLVGHFFQSQVTCTKERMGLIIFRAPGSLWEDRLAELLGHFAVGLFDVGLSAFGLFTQRRRMRLKKIMKWKQESNPWRAWSLPGRCHPWRNGARPSGRSCRARWPWRRASRSTPSPKILKMGLLVFDDVTWVYWQNLVEGLKA